MRQVSKLTSAGSPDDFLHPELKYPFSKSSTLLCEEEDLITFPILLNLLSISSIVVHRSDEEKGSILIVKLFGYSEKKFVGSVQK